jgi:hypothetical protein
MKKTTNTKTKLSATTAIVLLIFSAFAVIINMSVQAQLADEQPQSGPLPSGATPSITLETKVFLSVSPDPVGVDQTILINMWAHPPTHVERGFEEAFQLTITKPDNAQEIIGPISTYQGDATAWLTWQVDQVGIWTFKVDFFGMYYPAGYYMDGQVYTEGGPGRSYLDSAYYGPSSTPVIELTVQQEQVLSWPFGEPPTDYWERPASVENRGWWPILGHYPETGVVGGGSVWDELYPDTNIYMSNYEFIPYVEAPNTAHIAWKKPFMIGGLVGGEAEQISLTQPGLSGSGFPTIIYAGRAYEAYYKTGTGPNREQYWQCYDIRTGEVFWDRPLEEGESLPTFVEYAKQGAEVPGATARAGVTPYLVSIGNRLLKYDPWTGNVAINVSGPSGLSRHTLYGYPYVLSIQNLGGGNYRLINWTIENNAGFWRFAGGGSQLTVDNFTERIKGNITWPFSRISYADYEAGIAISTSGVSSPGTGTNIGYRIMGADIKTGELLWNITTDLSTGRETFFSGSTGTADHGKFVVRMNDGQIYAWNLDDGQFAWENEISSYPWGALGPYDVASAYGLYFTADYGCVRALDYDTGDTVWTYVAEAVPFETPYSYYDTPSYSWHSGMMVADGKFFSFNTEHTPTQPITRGWRLHAIDVTTGKGVWNITLGQGVPGSRSFQGAIADGYLAITNEYDGYMYVFGKGKSETTVTAPDVAVPKGTAFTIKGTVLDMSPGQPGTPCVSVDSMTTQMEYLHMQHPIDGIWHNLTITGVPVTLTAIGPNGEQYNLGTATTDGYHGNFGLKWTPTAEGTYEIIAAFEGDDSYGSSSAATFVTVGPAPSGGQQQETEEPTTEAPTTEAPTTEAPTTEAPTTEAPTTEVPTTEQPSAEAPAFPTTEVIIVAAVAVAVVVGVGAYWALRRRK